MVSRSCLNYLALEFSCFTIALICDTMSSRFPVVAVRDFKSCLTNGTSEILGNN